MSNPIAPVDSTTRDAILDLLAREALRQFGQSETAAGVAASKARIASNPDFISSIARLVASEVAALDGQLSEAEKLLKQGERMRATLTQGEQLSVDSQLVEIIARELPKSEAERLEETEIREALVATLKAGADPRREGVNPYDLAKRNQLAAAARALEDLGLNTLEVSDPAAAENAADLPCREWAFSTIEIDAAGDIIDRHSGTAAFYEEDLGNGIKLVMVKIPGGTFSMGSPEDEEQRRPNEGPLHQAVVPDFYLGKCTVTQAQWQEIMQSNPSKFKGADRPVERVSWSDCQEFCRRLTELTPKGGRIYRLPSEAEWEYACRAQTVTPFHFGRTLTTQYANFNGLESYGSSAGGAYLKETVAVGQYPVNGFGLWDMHGNVWERCQDEWHDNYSGGPTDGSAWCGSDREKRSHVIRGGSWFSLAWGCRSACRDSSDPGDRSYNVGFRIARSA